MTNQVQIVVKKNKLLKFIEDNKWVFLFGIVTFLIIYGRQLYVISPRVDTEALVNDPYGAVNWLIIGRQGGVFSRLLLEKGCFNPYYASIIAVIVYGISMIALSYLLDLVGRVKPWIAVMVFLVFMIHPIWMEQLYFTLQVLEISVALLLTILAVFMCYYGILNKNLLIKILAIIPMIWAFATYQAFVIVFIVLAITCFLLLHRRGDKLIHIAVKGNKTNNSEKKNINLSIIKLIIELLVLFIVAFIINSVITKLFFSSGSSYLDGQVLWGQIPIAECIKNILSHVKQVILCETMFYTWSYNISLIAIVVACLNINKIGKTTFMKVMYILAIIGMQVCPFLITVYGGTIPVKRAQYILPLVTSLNFGLAIIMFKNKIYSIVVAVLCIIAVFSNSQTVLRMQYTEDIRYQEDMRLAVQLEMRIQDIVGDINKPIAFVGTKPAALNSSCVVGELIGISLFDVNSEVSPHYLVSSDRICNLLRTMGFKFKNVTEGQMLEARKLAMDMSSWPEEDCIKEEKDYIIVKLSEDRWVAEDFDIKPTELGSVTEETDTETFAWNIDSISINGDKVNIVGWAVQYDITSSSQSVKVCLRNKESRKIYQLYTIASDRTDVNAVLKSEVADYTKSGFSTNVNIHDIDGDIGLYEIVLQYNNDSETRYINTEEMISENR